MLVHFVYIVARCSSRKVAKGYRSSRDRRTLIWSRNETRGPRQQQPVGASHVHSRKGKATTLENPQAPQCRYLLIAYIEHSGPSTDSSHQIWADPSQRFGWLVASWVMLYLGCFVPYIVGFWHHQMTESTLVQCLPSWFYLIKSTSGLEKYWIIGPCGQ